MTRFMKTTAIATLALTTAMPAYAAAHLDLTELTCGEYNAMSVEDQTKIANLAVIELRGATDGTVADNNGEAKAVESTEGTLAEESEAGSTTTIADNNGEATATTTVPAGNDESQFAEDIKLLNLTCARSINATIMEAAAGQDGTR